MEDYVFEKCSEINDFLNVGEEAKARDILIPYLTICKLMTCLTRLWLMH